MKNVNGNGKDETVLDNSGNLWHIPGDLEGCMHMQGCSSARKDRRGRWLPTCPALPVNRMHFECMLQPTRGSPRARCLCLVDSSCLKKTEQLVVDY